MDTLNSSESEVTVATSNRQPISTVQSFEACFVAEYPKMVALAAAVSGSRVYAEDIAQDAMGRLNREWANVQHFDKPGAWLRRVTINLALSQKRRRLNEAKALLRMGVPESTLPAPRTEDAAVWTFVAELPKQQRAAVALHFLEERSIDEIADILEISASTARVHLHRARTTLRTRLEEGLR